MDDVVELQNMEAVCRLCLSNDESKTSVFGDQDSLLASKIQACLSIQILTTDKLSTQICAQCVKNVNQWHSYKEVCLRSQDKLQQWFEKHSQPSPLVVTIKEEPVDLEFDENNIEVISESTSDSDVEVTNPLENTNSVEPLVNNVQPVANNVQLQEPIENKVACVSENQSPQKDLDISIKTEPQDDCDTDCGIEIESVTGNELVLNPLANIEGRIMEADSTQKSSARGSIGRKRFRRGPHTHYRGPRAFKQKCVHCQIFLHSKYSYTKHMERFHDKQNGSADMSELQDDEELIEDVEEELMSMEKDAPLTQVQQNIISQLKTFSCYACQQTFIDRNSTLAHIRQHMPDLRPYTCIACLTEFPDRSMYQLHCEASFECAMKIALVVPKHGEEKYFTCNMCLRSMPDRKQLLSHLSMHSDRQYEELVSPTRSPPKLKPMTSLPTKQEVNNSLFESTMDIPNPYKNGDPAHNFSCELCGMIYRYKPNMLKHKGFCQRLMPEARTCYRCVHCGMTYLVFKKFHTHIMVDHKKKELVCSECGCKFKSPSDYLDHHEKHRKIRIKKQPLEKNDPASAMPSSSMDIRNWELFEDKVSPNKLSPSKQYNCALCSLEFDTRAELMEHRNLHLKVKIYSCVICRSMFSSANALGIHMKDHGIEDANERSADMEDATLEDDSLGSMSSANASTVSDPGSTKNECGLCGKCFSCYANVRRHMRNIHHNASYMCTDCPQKFRSREGRDQHMAREHVKSRPMFRCTKCPKSFVFQANLNTHIRSAHGGKSEARCKCDICGKKFIEPFSLKIHRSWHKRRGTWRRNVKNEDQKSLVVSKQQESFNSNSERPARARKSFPNSPPAKPAGNFQCQVCSDKFNDVTELRKHLWDVHCARSKTEKTFSGEDFQCELCTNVYADKETLDAHMLWHKANPIFSDNQRGFTCEVCGKIYSTNKALSQHKQLHRATVVASMKLEAGWESKSRQFCTICQRLFSSYQALERHQGTMHRGLYNERHQQVPKSARSTFHNEPSTKRVKVEEDDKKIPFAMDAMNAGKRAVMCHVCKKFFANMSVLYKHKQLMHRQNSPMKNSRPMEPAELIPLPSNNGKVACNICFKKFPGISNLRQHFTIKHKFAVGPQPVPRPMSRPGTQTVSRQMTQAVARSASQTVHRALPRNLPQYRCTVDDCKAVFNTPLNLKNHELSHNNMIFCCTMCDKHMFSRVRMTNHMYSVHNIEYDAETNRNFHKEMDLNKYVVEGVVDTICPRCKIKYPNNKALKVHYFKFHEGKNE